MAQEPLTKKHLVLFFTFGVSLALWEKRGMLARELVLYRRLGHEWGAVTFVTYGRSDGRFAEQLAGDHITVLPKKYLLPNFLYSLILPWLYRKPLSEASVYKTNQMLGSWSAVIAAWLFGKRLIVRTGYPLRLNAEARGPIRHLLAKLIEWFAFAGADRLVVATDYEKEYYAGKAKDITVIPNYVDTDLFCPEEGVGVNEVPTILFIGRLEKEKNLPALIEGAAAIGEPIRLQMIGSGSLRFSLEVLSLAKAKNITVDFLGNIAHQDLPAYLNRADIFVLPSLYEGNPKVLIEAMACGRAALGTRVRGIDTVIRHGETGWLVSTDAHAIGQGVKTLLGDPSLRARLGVAARQEALHTYSLSAIIHKEIALYA